MSFFARPYDTRFTTPCEKILNPLPESHKGLIYGKIYQDCTVKLNKTL